MKKLLTMKKLLPIFILILSFSAFGQNRFAVSVDIQSKNKEVESSVESYITRELQSLGDVNVTDTNPFFKIQIMVTEAKVDNKLVGYVFSTVVSRWSQCVIGNEKSTCYVFRDHTVNLGGKDDIKSISEGIISDFDEGLLQPLRK